MSPCVQLVIYLHAKFFVIQIFHYTVDWENFGIKSPQDKFEELKFRKCSEIQN